MCMQVTCLASVNYFFYNVRGLGGLNVTNDQKLGEVSVR